MMNWKNRFDANRWTGILLLSSALVLSASASEHEAQPAKTVSEPAPTNSKPAAPSETNKADAHSKTQESTAAPSSLSREVPPSDNISDTGPIDGASLGRDNAFLLKMAQNERLAADYVNAEKDYLVVINGNAPDEMKKTALSDLAAMCEEAKQYLKAQKIYSQYARLYSSDPMVLEIQLRSGLLYREMGSSSMALIKFHTVMSSALTFNSDKIDYYKRLVLRAQTEVAETFYQDGKYADAADKLKLLLKLDSPELNRGVVLFKLIRCHYKLAQYSETITRAQMFLTDFPNVAERAEVRFLLAGSLKRTGRTSDCLEQVSLLLQSQQKTAATNPDNWRYWQQKTGNEIANMLYQEGDYINALRVYSSLAELDATPKWQLPALYQVGLVYEQLKQTAKAIETYNRILSHRDDPEITPLSAEKTIIDMAAWRQNRISWQTNAEEIDRDLTSAAPTPSPASPPP